MRPVTDERAVTLLKHLPLLHGADADDVAALAHGAAWREVPRGTVLFDEGAPATSLYAVERGWFKVIKLSPRGDREVTLHVDGPRQVLGGSSAFLEGADTPASAVALEDASVLCLPAELVRHVAFHSPALAQGVITYFARRQRDLIARLETLLFSEVDERLAAHLLARTRRRDVYRLPTNSELASLLGTVPELVSRKLGEFYRQGFIDLHRRELRVLNEAALTALSEGKRRRPTARPDERTGGR
jgi:CRP/FNR family transcriptional regulator